MPPSPAIAVKKARLDALRPLRGDSLANLRRVHDLELTWSSNAIEGNTLTALETSLVIEKGITVGGKPLRDHLEAVDHAAALDFVHALARKDMPLTAATVRELHGLVLQRSQPEAAGQYAQAARFVLTEDGLRHAFPSPAEIPALMGDFGDWLLRAMDTPEVAFQAHRELVGIHPFADGNGRTARLLMNLVLLRGGWPPIAIRPQDRLEYLRGLQESQAGRGEATYLALLWRRLEETLDEYLAALA